MNFYDFHIGDYASRTAHLEPMEDLAYRRMLDLYYVREEALPHDSERVATLIRLKGHADLVFGVLEEFFTYSEEEGGWIHKRCEKVIAAAIDKRNKAKASAAQRWHNEGNANALPTHSEGNAPSPTTQSHSQKKPPKPPKGGEPAGFEEFYDAYPKKQARVRAVKAFEKVSVPLAVLLEAVAWQREQELWTKEGGKYVPMPSSWLNDKRWEDQRPMVLDEPDWRQSRSGVERRAKQLGIRPWDEGEQWPIYLRRVVEADRGTGGSDFKSVDELLQMAQERKAA